MAPTNKEVAGVYKAANCDAGKPCNCEARVRPACGGGICITHYCFGCPFPTRFEYACKIGSCFCGEEAVYQFSGDKLSGNCGKKQWVRAEGGAGQVAPAGAEMAR